MVVLSSLNSYDFCWHVVWRPTFFLFLVNLMYIELPIFYFRDNIPFFLLCVDLLSTFTCVAVLIRILRMGCVCVTCGVSLFLSAGTHTVVQGERVGFLCVRFSC